MLLTFHSSTVFGIILGNRLHLVIPIKPAFQDNTGPGILLISRDVKVKITFVTRFSCSAVKVCHFVITLLTNATNGGGGDDFWLRL